MLSYRFVEDIPWKKEGKQLIPCIREDGGFRRDLRNKYLQAG